MPPPRFLARRRYLRAGRPRSSRRSCPRRSRRRPDRGRPRARHGPRLSRPSPTTQRRRQRSPWVYCEVSDYDVRVTTDKPVYQVGEVVRATISVTNNSDRECYTSGFRNSGASVFDAAGNNLGGVFTHGDCVGDLPCGDRFSPGTTKKASWCWSQHLDGVQPAPAGTYRMEILWQGTSGEVLIQTSGLPPAPTTTSNVYGIWPC